MFLIIAALFGFITLAETASIVATPENFDELKKEGVVMAKFHTPSCAHCKKFAPVWDKLVEKFDGKIKFLEVNCDQDETLADKYDLDGYPTVMGFVDGEGDYIFKEERNEALLSRWAKVLLSPPLTEVETLDVASSHLAKLEALDAENSAKKNAPAPHLGRLVVTGLFESPESQRAKEYASVAKKLRGRYTFLVMYGEKAKATGVAQLDSDLVAKTEEAPADISIDVADVDKSPVPLVIITKSFDDKVEIVPRDWTPKSLEFFLLRAKSKRFGQIVQENFYEYYSIGLPLGWVFLEPEKDNSEIEKIFRTISNKQPYKDLITFVWIDATKNGNMASRAGLSGSLFPSFGIETTDQRQFAFDESKELTLSNLEEFLHDYQEELKKNPIKTAEEQYKERNNK